MILVVVFDGMVVGVVWLGGGVWLGCGGWWLVCIVVIVLVNGFLL